MTEAVRRHYEASDSDLVSRVTGVLAGMGDGPLTAAQLAGFDQFHVRGLVATTELGQLMAIEPGSEVLDAGSGLGGPSRHMAETYGCRVTGVDLTASFVAVAELLAERTGMSGRVRYEVGDLLALPFADARFDAAYTQHVVMNIRDRAGAYGEIRRVLKPGGKFGFYDVLAGEGAPIFPVPWAETAETSALLTEAETRAVLAAAGFAPVAWNDVTAATVAWFDQQRPGASQGPNLAIAMGPRFAEMSANIARNLREGRVRVVMAVYA